MSWHAFPVQQPIEQSLSRTAREKRILDCERVEKMKTQSFISVITLVVLLTTSLQAGVIPGRWEKLDSQPPGKQMIVTLNSGDRMEYSFKSSGPVDLTVTDWNVNERKIPKSEVQTIVSAEKIGDSLLNGLLIGLGIGAASGVLATRIECTDDPECTVNAGIVAVPVGSVIGAVTGALIDRGISKSQLIYQRPKSRSPTGVTGAVERSKRAR